MITIEIPGRGTYQLEHLVLDVNGTIAEDGHLLAGVKARLERLGRSLQVVMVTSDTHGRQTAIDAELEMTAQRLQPGNEPGQKAALVRQLGAESAVAIGNGANDVQMLKEAAIGVAVLGPEGASGAALQAADVVCLSIGDALDLLANPQRLVATLRR